MDLNETATRAVERLRKATDSDRMPKGVRDLLDTDLSQDEIDELAEEVRSPADALRERAQELEARADDIESAAGLLDGLAEAVANAAERLDEYENAENRDDKREARQGLMDALGSIVEAYDEILNDGTDIDSDSKDNDDDEEEGDRALAIEIIEAGPGLYRAVLVNGPDERWVLVEGDREEVRFQAGRLAWLLQCEPALFPVVPVDA